MCDYSENYSDDFEDEDAEENTEEVKQERMESFHFPPIRQTEEAKIGSLQSEHLPPIMQPEAAFVVNDEDTFALLEGENIEEQIKALEYWNKQKKQHEVYEKLEDFFA